MSQFAPPPPPGVPEPTDPTFGPPPTPPYSATAITGFVLSFLGCAVLPAILGVIFGIAGIVSTADGRRRGRGLAVAAIPISLVTGGLALCLAVPGYYVMAAGRTVAMLPQILSVKDADVPQAVSSLRDVTTADFNEHVSDAQLRAWLQHVREKHGSLVEVTDFEPAEPAGNGDRAVVDVRGKFVNGPANIRVTFEWKDWRLKVADLEVEGVSPRASGGE